MKTKVAALRCDKYYDDEVYTAVKGAVDLLGGMKRFAGRNERILIKPNLLSGKPPEAAVTTHPSVVKAVIRLVIETGAVPVVGDSPGLGSAVRTAEKCGVMAACRETGAGFIELSELVKADNPNGHTFKRIEVAREALEADGVINVAKLKTHAQMFLTLGVKNIFGCVPGKRKPQWHLSAGVDTSSFASMLLDLYTLVNPRLTVLDGIVGMEGNGPASGDPRHIGLISASSHAVALDTFITEALGASPDSVPILKAAYDRGMPQARMSGVELLGARLEDIRVTGFRFPPQIHTNFASNLPYFIDKRLRKSLTSRPHVNTKSCTLCNICVDVCPALVMRKKDRIVIDYDNCIRCYCCQEMCPHGAITSKEGWLKKIIPGI